MFDINGDGVVSMGEFIRTLRRMQPPLELSKTQYYSLFTTMDVTGVGRKLHMADFVAFFLG